MYIQIRRDRFVFVILKFTSTIYVCKLYIAGSNWPVVYNSVNRLAFKIRKVEL